MGTIKEHLTTIDNKEYSCKTFPATEGLVLLPKLIALMGDKVANLIFYTDDEQQKELVENPKTGIAIMVQISERAAENDGLLIIKEVLKYTRCKQCRVGDAEVEASVYETFDHHFAGAYGHLFKVFSWVARVSFENP